MSDTVRHNRQQPTRLPCPWDSPGKNTGVGCHFPLQCMRVKSESEVTQSCPTLRNPMDRSPPGSTIHGIFQARVLEWGAIAFSHKGQEEAIKVTKMRVNEWMTRDWMNFVYILKMDHLGLLLIGGGLNRKQSQMTLRFLPWVTGMLVTDNWVRDVCRWSRWGVVAVLRIWIQGNGHSRIYKCQGFQCVNVFQYDGVRWNQEGCECREQKIPKELLVR